MTRSSFSTPLHHLVEALRGIGSTGAPALPLLRDVRGEVHRPVAGIAHDSRAVVPGGLFVALRGRHHDGHRWVPDMASASAVVVEQPVDVPEGVTRIRVRDGRRALSLLSAVFYGRPADRVPVVGITGTNGKTTVAWALEAILQEAGMAAAILGTTGHRLGDRPLSVEDRFNDAPLAHHTTPEAPVLHALLARALQEGAQVAVMEMSSIALEERRVEDLRPQVAVFTNLSRDHLDYHGTPEAYRAAKARLFHERLAPDGVAVINREDPAFEEMSPRHGPRVVTYGLHAGDLHVRAPRFDAAGTRCEVITPRGVVPLHFPLAGRHNLANALAALAGAWALGISPEVAVRGLARTRGVPGRLESPAPGSRPGILVDYAHTEDALATVLRAAREIARGRLWVVFGCGGDRDRGKRAGMGAAAARLADHVVVTSDNPRSEDPSRIIEQILPGVKGEGADAPMWVVEPDRARAIRLAVERAAPDDLVIIAGKGHETSQDLGDRILPFDDRRVAATALRARRRREGEGT